MMVSNQAQNVAFVQNTLLGRKCGLRKEGRSPKTRKVKQESGL